MHSKFKNILNFSQALKGKIISNKSNIKNFSSNISINSKTIEKNDFFIPLIGEKFNAHNFIDLALEKGIGTIIQKGEYQKKFIDSKVYIESKNNLKSLQNLSKENRLAINPKIIGITGSNGKTSTKEICAKLLSKLNNHTFSSIKNLNNHIGVPLNLIKMDENIKIACIEMGASAVGEIDLLSSLVMPDVGIITNIAPSHLLGFKTIENILKTKLELFKYTKGVKIINIDNKYLYSIKNLYENVITFGYSKESNFKIINIISKNNKYNVSFKYKDNTYNFSSNISGIHNIYNLIASIIAIHFLGYSIEEIINLIPKTNFELSGRLKKINYNSNIIFDDSYNANPMSVRAGIKYFCENSKNRKKILILGEMLELGEYSEHYHKEIGEFISDYNFNEIIFVGKQTKVMISKQKLENKINYFENVKELKDYFDNFIDNNENYNIYIKGSRSNKLDILIPKV